MCFPNFWLMKISGTYSWINAKKKKNVKNMLWKSPSFWWGRWSGVEVFSVVEIHGASLWCEGPSNEMRSRGFTGVWWGGLACFHFRLSDFGFFFFSCSRITVLLQGCSQIFVVFFCCLIFGIRAVLKWNLVTVLDIFHTIICFAVILLYGFFFWLDLDFLVWLFDSLLVSWFSWILLWICFYMQLYYHVDTVFWLLICHHGCVN